MSASQGVWGALTVYIEQTRSLSSLLPSGPLSFSANKINRPEEEERRPFHFDIWSKNTLFLWRKHLIYGRCLLVIRGLKRLSKVSEITLVYQIGTQTIDFLCKRCSKQSEEMHFFTNGGQRDYSLCMFPNFSSRIFQSLQGCLMSYNLSIAL